MYNQLLEQTEKAERLEEENQALRQEVKRLGREMSTFAASVNARIDAAVEKATKPLIEQLLQKDILIKSQIEEIVRLKAILHKDSGNSSKPPSSNGFKRVIVNSREPSGRKPGGQKGHPGHGLRRPENWEALKAAGKVRIEDHTNGSEAYESRYVLDIEINTKWTEHRYPRGAKELEGMPPIAYGERLQALAILLAEEEFVGQERVCDFIQFLSDGEVDLSEGWLNNAIQRFSVRLEGELAKIQEDLLNGPVMHTDETSMKTTQWMEPGKENEASTLEESQKTSKLAYLRVHSNEHSTLLTVNRHKDSEGTQRDGILPRFHGILSHDHDQKFYQYGSQHATCGEHLIRELKGIADGYGCEWPNEMRAFMKEMNDYKKADMAKKENPPTQCESEQFEIFSQRYDALLAKGILARDNIDNCYAQNELRRMLNRLRCYKDAYLLFMKDYTAPFTNNQAERDLRPCKNKQKISGCFRSWAGIIAFSRIRSFSSTVRKRNLNLMSAFVNVIRGVPSLD